MISLFTITIIISIIIIILWYKKTRYFPCFKTSGEYIDPINIDNFNITFPSTYNSSYVEVIPDSINADTNNAGPSNQDDTPYKYDYVYCHFNKKNQLENSHQSPGVSNEAFEDNNEHPVYVNVSL
jgi:hypothetical protein